MLDLSAIIKSREDAGSTADFVALAYQHDDRYPHAAFIIQHKGYLTEFHYDGGSVVYTTLFDNYFHKNTLTIHPDEVPAFIVYCKQIKQKAKPIYGFFYSGEFYDEEGNYLMNKDLEERMTCVGFCLNVLKGFLEEDYIDYTDWGSETHTEPDYLKTYCKRHNLDIDKVKASHRRITPLEYLTSGLFSNLPIRKSQIDGRKDDVKEYVLNRL